MLDTSQVVKPETILRWHRANGTSSYKLLGINDIVRGSVDMHTHFGPDPLFPRRIESRAALDAQEAGMLVTDVEFQLGSGAVGRFIFSLASAAREAVRLAVRILDGENASQIPVAKIDLNKAMCQNPEQIPSNQSQQ